MTFVPVERKTDPFDDPATAESWDQYVDSLSLANSSSMQDVASTVTTGTGVRYDPDTESLVVLSRTRSER